MRFGLRLGLMRRRYVLPCGSPRWLWAADWAGPATWIWIGVGDYVRAPLLTWQRPHVVPWYIHNRLQVSNFLTNAPEGGHPR